MRFLLVNTNNAVRKIFNITAKKAAIQLDVVGSINQIPLKEDYNCIFIDDGVLNTGDISKFKNKMITTKFCIILAKDSPLVSGFDSYIRKPFLPTDIYEVMKKEKSNDMSVASSSYANTGEGASVDTGVNANIDLNEFSDSEDEFLSGIKDNEQEINFDLDIPPTENDLGVDSAKSDFEIPATGGFVDNDFRDIDLDSSAESSTQNAESSENTDDFEINFTLDSAELSGGDTKSSDSAQLDIKATQDIDLDINKGADISLDSAPKPAQKPAPKKVDIMEEAEAQINNIKALADKGGNFFNSSNDTHDIDFSAVMALQDELLKEEENKNKKKLIGGDISKKKEPTKQELKAEPKVAESSASVAEKKPEKKQNLEKDIKQDFAEFENKKDSALTDSAIEKELDSADIMSAFELDSAELEKALDSAPTNSTLDSAPAKESIKESAKEFEKENLAPLGDVPLAENIASIDEQAPKAQGAQNSDFTSGLDVDLDALDSISSFSDIQSDSPPQAQATPKNATEILNNLDITNLNEGFENPSDGAEFEGSKYNILGLPINDSGEIKDINDLSESELEKLDDEALLLLQERALQDKSPKVLNKAQIDAINDILEDTQSTSDFNANNFGTSDFGANNFATQASGFSAQPSEFSMNNNEFQSLTQEALSEALDEGEIASNQNQILEQDFGAQGFTKDYVADSFTQDFATDNFTQDFGGFQNMEAPIAESSVQNFANPAQNPQNIQNIQSPPTKQISINDNLDLAEIIKTFPIDKLRDLLSGVQITINITFPTKKK